MLNIHLLDEIKVFEIARVGYLQHNVAAVRAVVMLTEIESDIRDAVAHGHVNDLPQLCWDLVHDHDRRHALEQKGRRHFFKAPSTRHPQTRD